MIEIEVKEIISRKEAVERGLKNYHTGKECKHGHISDRDTVSGSCKECKRLRGYAWRNKPENKKEPRYLLKVGDRFESNNFGWYYIKEYHNYKNIVISFEVTGFTKTVNSWDIYGGRIKDKLVPSVYGVGFEGEGGFKPTVEGITQANYKTWSHMMERCYSEAHHARFPTYKDCTVHKDWHNFQNFAEFYELNYIEDYQLDKDLLLIGNKVYSKDTCVFVPRKINSFLGGHTYQDKSLKRGVSYHPRNTHNPYTACITKVGSKGNVTLGSFPTETLAYQAYTEAKHKQLLKYKEELDCIDSRIFSNLCKMINYSTNKGDLDE